jgi:hypothetical protein
MRHPPNRKTGNMKKNNQPRKTKPPVLEGYKKTGSTFVPPMIHQLGKLDYISWSTQIMPELIWWDVLIDRVSNRFAAKVAEEIGKCLKDTVDRRYWWAFISDYAQLGKNDMNGLKDHLSRANILVQLTESLIDFLDLYPECPISRFLDHRPTGIVDVSYLQHFEERMKVLEDKRSRNGVFVQAQAVYMGFVQAKLFVKRGLALADFPEVERYPSTERSQQVGASICATVNGLAGTSLPEYSKDAWVQYFWRRSLDLRPLDFSHLENQ